MFEFYAYFATDGHRALLKSGDRLGSHVCVARAGRGAGLPPTPRQPQPASLEHGRATDPRRLQPWLDVTGHDPASPRGPHGSHTRQRSRTASNLAKLCTPATSGCARSAALTASCAGMVTLNRVRLPARVTKPQVTSSRVQRTIGATLPCSTTHSLNAVTTAHGGLTTTHQRPSTR